MRPEALIAAHLDLLHRAENDPLFRRQTMTGIVRQEECDKFADILADAIAQAYLYRVSDEMSQLVRFAASQLDDTDEWDHTLAPTAAGLVRFDTPLTLHDGFGNECKAHWMMWGPSEGGTISHFWNDMRDPDKGAKEALATFHPETLASIGYWSSINGAASIKDGFPMGPIEVPAHAFDVDLWDRLQEGTVTEKTAFGNVPRTLRPATNSSRLVHAFWLLLSQQVVETDQPHVKARAQRQAERAGTHPEVTVVTLRRSPGSKGAGESTVEWSRRWVVRGHWRWQAHGTGRRERRRIWIAPFIKGPEEKPLVLTTKVYDVR